MSYIGWMLIIFCATSAAFSSLLMRMGVDKAGGFVFAPQALIKLFAQPVFIIGVILYGLAGIAWFRVIATEQLSIAYPILVSLAFAIVSLGAVFFFKEPLGGIKIVGMGLIVVGIWCMSYSS